MQFNVLYLVLALLSSVVVGDVSISSPKAGLVFDATAGTTSVNIAWIESGSEPALKEFQQYVFMLCTGPNTLVNCFLQLAKVLDDDLTGNEYDLVVQSAAASDGLYYIQITSVAKHGYTIHYSSRFSLTGMTGTVVASGTGNPPSAQYNFQEGATTQARIDSRSFTVPYTLQKGKTRYAPMQTQPGSKITATTWSRRFATSSVSYYTTFKKSPVVLSTLTPGWSYSVESLVNYASPAPHPSVLGWYAASERIQSASLSSYATASGTGDGQKKRKRWDID